MEIKQSYIMTIARAKLSLYEQRLLIKCVQSGQPLISNKPLGAIRRPLEHNNGTVEIEIAMKELCECDKSHYEYIIKAAQSLTQKNFTYIDEKGNWVTFSWVMRATHKKKTGKVYLLMDKHFYDCLYNFTHGYSHYDLERALNFKRPQTMRLYALLNGQKKPISYTIEQLKHITGTTGLYTKTNDFIRKVIEPAHQETKQGDYGQYWEYTTRKTGNKITSITFTPVQRAAIKEEQASIKGITEWLPIDYTKLLLQHGGFTTWQLSCHKALLSDLSKLPNGLDLLLAVIQRARARRPANMQGYIINALKMEVKSIAAAIKSL